MFRIFLRLIAAYQRWVSPFLGPNCRFAPSCSQYTYEAVERYGIFRGMRFTTMRLLKCHPFHPGGADPVP